MRSFRKRWRCETDVLKSLFDGNIRLFEQSGRLTPEASGLLKEVVIQEEQLLSQLDENTAETLRTYQASRDEVNYLVTLERFKDAFILSAKMMMEILSDETRHDET